MTATAGSLLGMPALPALEGPVGEYLRVAESTLLRVQELRGHVWQLEASSSPEASRRGSVPAASAGVVAASSVSGGKRKRSGRNPTSSVEPSHAPPADASSSGLRRFSRLVCDRVAAAGPEGATYAAVADELVVAAREGAVEGSVDEKNVRRRVYDALNVLEACGALKKVGKDVAWIGWPSPNVLRQRGTDVEAAGRMGAGGPAAAPAPLRRGRSASVAAGAAGGEASGASQPAGGEASALDQPLSVEALAVGQPSSVSEVAPVAAGVAAAEAGSAGALCGAEAATASLRLVPKAEAPSGARSLGPPSVKLEIDLPAKLEEPASPPCPGGSSSLSGETTTPPKEEGLRKMASSPGSARALVDAEAAAAAARVPVRGARFSDERSTGAPCGGLAAGASASPSPLPASQPTLDDAKAAVDVAEEEALRLVRLVRLAVRNRLREVQVGSPLPERCLALPFALVVAPPGSRVRLRRDAGGRRAEVAVEPDSFALLDDDRVLQVLEAVRGSAFALPSPEVPVDSHSLIVDLLYDGWSGSGPVLVARPPTAPASPVATPVRSTPASARSSPVMPRAATLSTWAAASPAARTPSPAGVSPARRARPHTPTSEGPATPQDRLLGETPPPLFSPLSLGSPLFDLAYSSPSLLGRTSAMATPAEQLLSSLATAWSPAMQPLRAPSAGLADRQGPAALRGISGEGLYGVRPGTADPTALDGDGDLPLFGGLDGDEPVGWTVGWHPRRLAPRPPSEGRSEQARTSLDERLAASAAAVANSYEDLERSFWTETDWTTPKPTLPLGPRAQGNADDPGNKPSGP